MIHTQYDEQGNELPHTRPTWVCVDDDEIRQASRKIADILLGYPASMERDEAERLIQDWLRQPFDTYWSGDEAKVDCRWAAFAIINLVEDALVGDEDVLIEIGEDIIAKLPFRRYEPDPPTSTGEPGLTPAPARA